jgi:hypothetical protein
MVGYYSTASFVDTLLHDSGLARAQWCCRGDGGGGGPTSSGEAAAAAPRPAAGIPRNRRPDSWAPWEDVALGQYKPVQVGMPAALAC